jgi:hypothetical protein
MTRFEVSGLQTSQAMGWIQVIRAGFNATNAVAV